MRFFNKYFFIGLCSGVVLTIGLIFLPEITEYIMFNLAGGSGKREAMLRPPEFPVQQQQVSVYERPDQWTFRTLDGTEMAFSQFKGKVVFLNFWATWCPHCVAELPNIQNLYDSLKNEDVAFLLISDEDTGTIRKFMEKKRYNLPVYLRGKDLPKVFATQGIPATFILDRDGMIAFKHVGSAKWDDESCRSFILGLK
jgi:thiol-disulfide isomerase/thioredoxin